MRNHILNSLLALFCGITAVGLVAAPAAGALLNANDHIWEADAWMGNIHLQSKYKESPENGLIDQSLEVELQHVPAGTTVQVMLNGSYMLGSMTADATGHARLSIDILGVQPNAQGRPVGPRIETGDVISVVRGAQSLSASFVQVQ